MEFNRNKYSMCNDSEKTITGVLDLPGIAILTDALKYLKL